MTRLKKNKIFLIVGFILKNLVKKGSKRHFDTGGVIFEKAETRNFVKKAKTQFYSEIKKDDFLKIKSKSGFFY